MHENTRVLDRKKIKSKSLSEVAKMLYKHCTLNHDTEPLYGNITRDRKNV